MALVTTQSKPFIQLVQLQQQSLEALNKIKDSVSSTSEQQTVETQSMQLDQLSKILDVQRDYYKSWKKNQADTSKQMSDLAGTMKKWKTWGDSIRDIKQGMADSFNPANIKKKLFGAFNVGGVFNQKIQAIDYAKRQKEMGSTKSPAELRSDGKNYAAAQRSAMLAQQKIDRLKGMGATDEQIAASRSGKGLVEKRDKALAGMNRLDNKSSIDANNKMGGNVTGKSAALPKKASDKGQVPQSTTDLAADQQSSKENQLESLRLQTMQIDLLSQIADNTGGKTKTVGGAAGASGQSNASLSGVTSSFQAIGDSVAGLGGGIGKGVGALIGGVFTGIMQGIADGIAALGTGKVLKGVAVLGILGAVIYGVGQAFDSLAKLDWDSINAGLLTIGAVTVAAFALGKVAPTVLLGSLALAAIGGALWVVGQAFQAVGDGFESMTEGLMKLSELDGAGLLGVAGGIAAIGASLAVFGAGQAAAGLGTLVGNLLTIGQDSPIEQLQKLASMGDSLNSAAAGIDSIGKAMVGFSGIDKKSMDAINDFPWLKATAFVAAGGSMSVSGVKVSTASKSNEDTKAAVEGQNAKPASSNTNTAIQNNTTNKMQIKPAVRNQESSQAKYMATRY
jgi:hypothetical protein